MGRSHFKPSSQEEAFSSFQGTCLGTYSLQKEVGHSIIFKYRGKKMQIAGLVKQIQTAIYSLRKHTLVTIIMFPQPTSTASHLPYHPPP